MMSLRKLLRRTVVAAGAAAIACTFASNEACTRITNTTAIQCTSEAECLALGPDFANTTCDATSKTCVKLDVNVGLCSKNSDCIQQFGGAPAICRKSDQKCVALTTPECPRVLTLPGNQELLNDDTVVVGAFTPTGYVELGTVMEAAIGLAQQEIATSFYKGLPPAPGASGSRPFVVVSCLEFGSGIEGLLRGAQHLVNDVQVPVVIGPVDPSNAGIVASEVFLPAKTLTVLPTAITDALSSLPNPAAPTPILWRTNFDDASIATAASAFIQDQLEPRINARGVQTTKVVILADGNLLGRSNSAAMVAKLKFNGVSGTQNEANGNLIVIDLGDLNDTLNNPNPDAKIAAAIAQTKAFAPQIVLHSYATRGISPVYFPLESSWPAGVPLPYHIGLTPPWNTFGPLFNFIDAVPSRRSRIFGIQNYTYPVATCDDTTDPKCHGPFPLASQAVQAWLTRFTDKYEEFATDVSPKNQLVWQLYDATYLAAYSIVAAGTKPITGSNLGATLPMFLNGNPKQVRTYNPEDIPVAFGALLGGQGIDLQGLASTLDLNAQTAVASYGLEVTCPSVTNNVTQTFTGSGYHILDSGESTITTSDGTQDLAPTSAFSTACPAIAP